MRIIRLAVRRVQEGCGLTPAVFLLVFEQQSEYWQPYTCINIPQNVMPEGAFSHGGEGHPADLA
jgi:hypothetical protein